MGKRVSLPIVATLLAILACGCGFGRYRLDCPGENQVVQVTSGDRFFFDLEENPTTGYLWDYTCDDNDVEVTIDHEPLRNEKSDDQACGKPSFARVMVRIHRGYDGPSTVTFTHRRKWEKKPIKEFTLTLFRRTGDCAFWER